MASRVDRTTSSSSAALGGNCVATSACRPRDGNNRRCIPALHIFQVEMRHADTTTIAVTD